MYCLSFRFFQILQGKLISGRLLLFHIACASHPPVCCHLALPWGLIFWGAAELCTSNVAVDCFPLHSLLFVSANWTVESAERKFEVSYHAALWFFPLLLLSKPRHSAQLPCVLNLHYKSKHDKCLLSLLPRGVKSTQKESFFSDLSQKTWGKAR